MPNGSSALEDVHQHIEPKTHKCTPNRKDVELLATLETASISLCGIAMLLWMSIGTFTRADWGEAFAQKTIFVLCVTSAILLFSLHHLGGELWGSRNVALLFALTALIVAAAGSLNIKGQDVQGEINPSRNNEDEKTRKRRRLRLFFSSFNT